MVTKPDAVVRADALEDLVGMTGKLVVWKLQISRRTMHRQIMGIKDLRHVYAYGTPTVAR